MLWYLGFLIIDMHICRIFSSMGLNKKPGPYKGTENMIYIIYWFQLGENDEPKLKLSHKGSLV